MPAPGLPANQRALPRWRGDGRHTAGARGAFLAHPSAGAPAGLARGLLRVVHLCRAGKPVRDRRLFTTTSLLMYGLAGAMPGFRRGVRLAAALARGVSGLQKAGSPEGDTFLGDRRNCRSVRSPISANRAASDVLAYEEEWLARRAICGKRPSRPTRISPPIMCANRAASHVLVPRADGPEVARAAAGVVGWIRRSPIAGSITGASPAELGASNASTAAGKKPGARDDGPSCDSISLAG